MRAYLKNHTRPDSQKCLGRKSLRFKTICFVGIAFGFQLLVLGFVATRLIKDSFQELEARNLEKSVSRINDAMDKELGRLEAIARDYQSWDDTWDFMQGNRPQFMDENFTPASVANLGLVFVAYYGTDLQEIHGLMLPPEGDAFSTVPDDLRTLIRQELSHLANGSTEASRTVLIAYREDVVAVSALPVLRTDGQGPVPGYGVFARKLDEDFIADLASVSGLEEPRLRIGPPNETSSPSYTTLWISKDQGLLSVCLQAEPDSAAIFLDGTYDAEIVSAGRSNIQLLIWIVAVIGLTGAAMTVWLLDRTLIRRLTNMSKAVKEIAFTEEAQKRLAVRECDELGQLARNFDELLDRVEMAEKDLRESARKERAASEAKSLFLANMSHEIRTPMNGIYGMVQLVRGSRLDEEQTFQLETIDRSCKVMLDLLNDILEFSKLEADALPLMRKPVNLKSLISDVIALMQESVEARNLELQVELKELPPAVVLDGVRFRQVILNLINNAIKFTEKGRITLTVTANGVLGQSGTLTVSVADTGIGISEDQIKRLFEPFSQVDPSLTRRAGGAGLGLSICRRLVRLMGGELNVHSVIGHGSTFEFSIPAEFVEAIDEPAESVRSHSDAELSKHYPLKILIAEDNPVNRLVLNTMLKRMGYACDLAHDGGEALAKALDNRYDLIFMDIQMPVMDGLTATRELFARLSPSERPVVAAVTAHAFEDDIRRCLDSGMHTHLGKPVHIKKLREALQEVYRIRQKDRTHLTADPLTTG